VDLRFKREGVKEASSASERCRRRESRKVLRREKVAPSLCPGEGEGGKQTVSMETAPSKSNSATDGKRKKGQVDF